MYINQKKFMRTFDKYVKIDIPLPSITNIDLSVSVIDDVLLIDGLLDRRWCQTVIDLTNESYSSLRDEYPESSRDSERFLTINTNLSKFLWENINEIFKNYFNDSSSPIQTKTNRPNIPYGFGVSGKWKPIRINECFRFNKYIGPSVGFKPHRDSLYVESYDKRSIYTILIYLNDIDINCNEGDFDANTVFLKPKLNNNDYKLPLTVNEELINGSTITSCIKPKAGSIAIMCHNRIHCGMPFKSGYKYVIRSDIIFERYEHPEYYTPQLWRYNELFLKAVGLYNDAKAFEMCGDVISSTKFYEKGLAIRQSTYI